MGWVRQHCKGREQVVVTANIWTDEGAFRVLLASHDGSKYDDPTPYDSLTAARQVADALVRQRHIHDCGATCGVWIEETE